MKIRSISCEQFAGIKNRNISLSDHLNVIFGQNESGKSTMMELLLNVLTRDSKIDLRSDKEFKKKFYPAPLNGSRYVSDCVDGCVEYEADGKRYKLSKYWGMPSSAKLTMPNGDMIVGDSQIAEIIREQMKYGKGIYSEILFASQKNCDDVLRKLFEGTSDMGKEMTEHLISAYSSIGAVSGTRIEEEIGEKIAAIVGKYGGRSWDESQNKPTRGTTESSRGLGTIHDKYFDYIDAKAKKEKYDRLSQECSEKKKDYYLCAKKWEESKKTYKSFMEYYTQLEKRSTNRKHLDILLRQQDSNIRNKKDKETIASLLPKLEELSKELQDRSDLDDYAEYQQIRQAAFAEMKELSGIKVKEEDIDKAATLEERIKDKKRLLSGIRIIANLKLFNGSIKVRSIADGREILPINGKYHIDEAVTMIIPDILEMELAPADINVDKVTEELHDLEKQLQSLFYTFAVSGIQELKQIVKRAADLRESIKKKQDLTDIHGKNITQLEKKCKEINAASIRKKEEIEKEVRSLIGFERLDSAIATYRDRLSRLNENYDDLISQCESEIGKIKAELETSENIPAEYQTIDPADFRKRLEDTLSGYEEDAKKLYHEFERSNSDLNSLEGRDYDALLSNAETKFNEEVETLRHWRHIERIFREAKEKIKDRPVDVLAKSFSEYLHILTGGTMKPEFPNGENLNMQIYSHDYQMDYDKLSEGAKETMFFAFRLACVDQLFPDGGGIIVLDDPFTDMDDVRLRNAVTLLDIVSQKHQVIFLTCKEEQRDLFVKANTICLSNIDS